MRSGVAFPFVLAMTLLAGCEQALPVSPAGSVDGSQGSGVAPIVTANLVLTDVSAIAFRPSPSDDAYHDDKYWGYDPRFRIVERSGRSGAVIKKGRVSAPFPVTPPDWFTHETGEGCWRIQVRVEAGGTLNTFFGEPPGVPDRCAPEFSSTPVEPLPSLEVAVTYVDDSGRISQLVTSIPVTLR